jgi:CBS domain-containing protein
MDEGILVGIVAREDVLKALARAAEGLLPDRLQQ